MKTVVFAVAVVLGALLCGGCVGTETGNPSLDPNKVTIVEETPGILRIDGTAGAVEPASALVRVLDLEGTDGFRSITANADGSFTASFAGDPLRLFRADALLGAERSLPFDLRVLGAPGAPIPCLQTAPEAAIELGTFTVGESRSVPVELVNSCGALGISFTITAARERLGNGDYMVTTAVPIMLAGGARTTTSVDFVASASGVSEAVVVFVTDRGDVAALSLRARVR